MTDVTGILNVHKATGWTSHDVVAKVRRLAGQKRVGHAGTLDPLAEGVLPILLGRATRLADFVQQGEKTYRAAVALGASTETDDREGSVSATAPVPALSAGRVEEALSAFRGEIMQKPPAYSALKVGGQRAYAVARRGEDVDLAPRPVTIHALDLLSLDESSLELEVTCSKGTYIRALARDLAIALGTLGHLSGLVRTRVGPFRLSDSLTLDAIADRGAAHALLPASQAIPEAPLFNADADQTAKLLNGQAVPVDSLHAQSVWVYDPSGQLVCLASADGSLLRPRLAL
ncbi:MAG TPA: tRNA pseudouridine(55) synthase TruB [Chloroflexota bacterium]